MPTLHQGLFGGRTSIDHDATEGRHAELGRSHDKRTQGLRGAQGTLNNPPVLALPKSDCPFMIDTI